MLCNFLETVTTLFCIRMFSFRFYFLYTCICLSFDVCLLPSLRLRFALDSARTRFYFVCAAVEVVWLCHYSGFIIQSNALCWGLPGPVRQCGQVCRWRRWNHHGSSHPRAGSGDCNDFTSHSFLFTHFCGLSLCAHVEDDWKRSRREKHNLE